jgi:stress-induced morphogen
MRRALTGVCPSLQLILTPRTIPLKLFLPSSRTTILPLTTPHYSLRTATMATTTTLPPVEGKITRKLQEAFKPVHLEVINESYKHKVPAGSESHFKVVVVSEVFNDKPLLDRHSILPFYFIYWSNIIPYNVGRCSDE